MRDKDLATITARWRTVNSQLRLVVINETDYCVHGNLLEDECEDCVCDSGDADEREIED